MAQHNFGNFNWARRGLGKSRQGCEVFTIQFGTFYAKELFLILGSFDISEHPGDKILNCSPKIYTLPIGVIVACCLGVGPLQK